MEKLHNDIENARRRVEALVNIARSLWIINLTVGVVGITHHRYDVAALAAFTWILALVATAFARRTAKHLIMMEQIIRLQ